MEEEGTDVTDLTIIGNAILQHEPKHTKERQKEGRSFWGAGVCNRMFMFFPFPRLKICKNFWVKQRLKKQVL
jgi:hypothetical protein